MTSEEFRRLALSLPDGSACRRQQKDRRVEPLPAAMVTIDVVLLGPGDEPLLSNVAPGVFDDPLDARATALFLADPRHRLAVALDGGCVVGFASAVVYVHPDKPRPELWINEVGVAETHQRRGLGRRLIQALLDVGRAAGCREAWVLTDRGNAAAMQLYASAGGEEAPGSHAMFTFFLETDP